MNKGGDMMLDNVNAVGGMGGVQPRRKTAKAYNISEAPASADSVEFSSDVMHLNGVKGVRLDKVMEIRAKMSADPGYFSAKKVETALDRAMDEVFGGIVAGG
jgi:hypothetical protein